MAQTIYGDISQRTAGYASKKMLEHAEPILILSKFADNKPLPKNTADNIKFRRPVPFAPATTPLVEGVSPTARKMVYADVNVTLEQFGDVVGITDKVHDMNEDPVLADATLLCGEQAAETLEMILWGVIQGGTSVFYGNASDGARTDVNDPISIGRIRSITRAIKSARGKPINQMLAPSVNIGTVPIEGGYVCVAHTDCDADIRALPGFKTTAEYGSRKVLCPEELGSVENVRFITTPLLEPIADSGSLTVNGMLSSGTKVDVYPMIFLAKNAFGASALKGMNAIAPKVLNPGIPRGADALGQRGTVGWITHFAGVRLNETWMARLEVGVTANPI